MKKRITSHIRRKNHSPSEINRELLYKNRLTQSVYFIILLVAACTVNMFMVYYTLSNVISISIVDKIFDVFIFSSLLLGFFILPYHPRHYGFNLNNLRDSIVWGLGLGLVFFATAIGFRLFMVNSGADEFRFDLDMHRFLRDLFYYTINALAQEALFRGSMQSYFVAVFEKARWCKPLAIFIPSVIFAQFHILYGGIWIFAGAFVFSILLGFIYERSRSLVAVTIIHYLTGAGLFFFSSAIK